MQPQKYIVSSDYASIENDDYGTLQVTVPSGVVVTAGSFWSDHAEIDAGQIGASLRAQIESSKDPGRFFVGLWQDRMRTGTVSGSPAFYDIFVVLSRLDEDTLMLTATIFNPYGASLTGASGAEIFTANVTTFLSPFE